MKRFKPSRTSGTTILSFIPFTPRSHTRRFCHRIFCICKPIVCRHAQNTRQFVTKKRKNDNRKTDVCRRRFALTWIRSYKMHGIGKKTRPLTYPIVSGYSLLDLREPNTFVCWSTHAKTTLSAHWGVDGLLEKREAVSRAGRGRISQNDYVDNFTGGKQVNRRLTVRRPETMALL